MVSEILRVLKVFAMNDELQVNNNLNFFYLFRYMHK